MKAYAFIFLSVVLYWPLALFAQTGPAYNHPLFTGPAHTPPQQVVDQQHLRLDLTLNPAEQTLSATADLWCESRQEGLTDLVLYGRGLALNEVRLFTPDSTLMAGRYTQRGDSILVHFEQPLPRAQGFRVHMAYTAQPVAGLHFVPRDGGLQIWTESGPTAQRHWLPSFDYPQDVLTSEMHITVPEPMTVLAAGELVTQTANPAGTQTFHYRQRQPQPAYRLGFVADAYAVFNDTFVAEAGREVLLEYGIYPERMMDVVHTFGRTPEILAFFAEKLKVAFPLQTYVQAAHYDFSPQARPTMGLMPLADDRVVDARAAADHPPEPTLAHDAAHVWFGHLVTPQYWHDLWLSEGFATYLAHHFTAHDSGQEIFQQQMLALEETYRREAQDYRRAVVWNRWTDPAQLFDAHTQAKGAWVLHMMRHELGDDAFWRILHQYLRQHAGQLVETSDLMDVIEQTVQLNPVPFFDQWVFSAGHPEITVNYTYFSDARTLEVQIEQAQTGPMVPPVFRFEAEIEVQTLVDTYTFSVALNNRVEKLNFPLDSAPRFVVFDPENHFLDDTEVVQPYVAWIQQLKYAQTLPGRLRAAMALAQFPDSPDVLIGLQDALKTEPHAVVRQHTLRITDQLERTPAVERLLVMATQDAAAEVRQTALVSLGRFTNSNTAIQTALTLAQSDPSYEVQAEAVRTLARLGAPNALAVIRSALVTDSHRDVIRVAAFEALRYIPNAPEETRALATDWLGRDRPVRPRMAAIAYLGNQGGFDMETLAGLHNNLADPRAPIRRAVLNALAISGTRMSLPVLQAHLEREPDPRLLAHTEAVLQQIARRN